MIKGERRWHITLLRPIAVLCGTDIILWNILHIQYEREEYFIKYYEFIEYSSHSA